MSEAHLIQLVWLGGLVVVVLVLLGVDRMVRGRSPARHRRGARRRWLIIPAALIVAVYAAQYGLAPGRSQLFPILTLLVLLLVAVALLPPGDKRG